MDAGQERAQLLERLQAILAASRRLEREAAVLNQSHDPSVSAQKAPQISFVTRKSFDALMQQLIPALGRKVKSQIDASRAASETALLEVVVELEKRISYLEGRL